MEYDMNNSTQRCILSCDGGGIKGLITLKFLERLEHETNIKIYDMFDMFVGTSVNSFIMALIVYKKYSPTDIINLYFNDTFFVKTFKNPSDKVRRYLSERKQTDFVKSMSKLTDVFGNIRLTPKYKNYADIMLEEFGDLKLCDTQKKILLPTLNLTSGEPIVITNFGEYSQLYVRDICLSAITIPGLFPINKIVLKNSISFEIDGGLYRNNPCDIAYAYANKIWGNSSQFSILSIGTGGYHTNLIKQPENWGFIQWFFNFGDLLNKSVYGNNEITSQLTDKISYNIDHNFLRINPRIDHKYNSFMCHYSETSIVLNEYGNKWWDTYKKETLELLKYRIKWLHSTNNDITKS